jgi:hypothetical protein
MRSVRHNSALAALLLLSLTVLFAQVCDLGCDLLGCAPSEVAVADAPAPTGHCHQSAPEPEPQPDHSPDCGNHAFAAGFELPGFYSASVAPPSPDVAAAVSRQLDADFALQSASVRRGASFRSPPKRPSHSVLRI